MAGTTTKRYGGGWGELRRSLTSAKMADAFKNEVLEIRGVTYNILNKLGDGGFAKVYLVYGNEDRTLRAAKVAEV